MIFHGLKLNIAIHTAIILIIGMTLIGLVALNTFQRLLINSELDRGDLLLKAMSHHSADFFNPQTGEIDAEFKYLFQEMVLGAGFCYARLTDAKSHQRIEIGLQESAFNQHLTQTIKTAMQSGKPSTALTGTTWDVWGRQPRYAVMAAPLFGKTDIRAGVGIVFDFDKKYLFFRQTQFILFVLMLTNTVILTFIGTFSMGKIIVRPIQRLVDRMDAFTENDQQIFFTDKKNNEFNVLSKSINSMVRRIAQNKEKLEDTILSLEESNNELKRAQNNIIRAEKMASVGRLAAGIAHEIGNPIGIVMGYMELLGQDDITPEEHADFLTRASDEIARIDVIIKQLLNYSRTSSIQNDTVSVHKVIQDTLDIVNIQPVMARVEIQTRLKAENDVVIADTNQLRQVCLNLILNAADAIAESDKRDKGELLITTELGGLEGSSPVLIIQFRDNGAGIAPKDIRNVFDPFFTTKEPGKGTGLGLSVSFKIIERLGGVITAHSDEGIGTTMTIQLPLDSDTPADQA